MLAGVCCWWFLSFFTKAGLKLGPYRLDATSLQAFTKHSSNWKPTAFTWRNPHFNRRFIFPYHLTSNMENMSKAAVKNYDPRGPPTLPTASNGWVQQNSAKGTDHLPGSLRSLLPPRINGWVAWKENIWWPVCASSISNGMIQKFETWWDCSTSSIPRS